MEKKMQNKGKAVFYAIAGGYLIYLAYQLFGSRMDDGGKNYMLSLIFSIFFVVAGAGILIYTAIMYQKMLKAEAENGDSQEESGEPEEVRELEESSEPEESKEPEGEEISANEEEVLKDKQP